MTATALLAKLHNSKPTRNGWQARCPAHEDDTASLSLAEGKNGRVLVKCFAGCSSDAIVEALGLTLADLMPEADRSTKPRIVAIYRYEDERGAHLYDVIRYAPKDFRQRPADYQTRGSWKMNGVRRVVYRLRQVQGQAALFIPEGERDCDALAALDLPATCNAGGAGKWRDDYARQIWAAGGKRVCVLPDNDDPGRAHAAAVAASCRAVGLEVRVLALPNLPAKCDVSDWLAGGGTKAALLDLARRCPVWTPAASATSALRPVLDLVGLDALLAEPDDAVEWVVDDRFAHASVNLLAGRPKAGKSTLARALALAVARGETWLGSRCRFGAVVYVALEDKRAEVRRHLRSMGATGQEPIRLLIGQAPKTLLADLAALIASGDTIDLLVIDTAQRLLAVKDANDYAIVTTAFEPVLALARTHGTCIVLLHHAGKADRAGIEQILGSTAWAGSVDNVLLLNRTQRYRVLSSVQRIGPDLEETVIAMDDTTGDVRMAGSRYLVDRQAVAAALFEAVAAAGPDGITRPDLLAAIEARRELKLKALVLLGSDPRICRTGEGTNRHPHRYALVMSEPVSPIGPTAQTGSRVPPNGWEPDPPSLVPSIPTATQTGSRGCAGSHGSHDDDVVNERY